MLFSMRKIIALGLSMLAAPLLISCRQDIVDILPTQFISVVKFQQDSAFSLLSIKKAELVDDTSLVLLDGGSVQLHVIDVRTGVRRHSIRFLDNHASFVHKELDDSLVVDGELAIKLPLRAAATNRRDPSLRVLFEGLHDYRREASGELTFLTYSSYPYERSDGGIILQNAVMLVRTNATGDSILSGVMARCVDPAVYSQPSCFTMPDSQCYWVSALPGYYDSKTKTRLAKYTKDGHHTGVVSEDPLRDKAPAFPLDRQWMSETSTSSCFLHAMSFAGAVDVVHTGSGSAKRYNMPDNLRQGATDSLTPVSHIVRLDSNVYSILTWRDLKGSQPYAYIVPFMLSSSNNEIRYQGAYSARKQESTLMGTVSTFKSTKWRGKVLAIFQTADEEISLEELRASR
jgi:hypothetical protein